MKVSIIIPVYNSERYIRRCLESVLKQNYENIEVIVIDDGSTDRSLKICKEYIDVRLKIYSKLNEGVSKTRNLGIENSTGDMILFVDADDYIDKSMVKALINNVSDKDNSFILCDNKEIYKDREEVNFLFEDDKKIGKNEVFHEIAKGRGGLVCSKLISKKILEENNILFKENIGVSEDQIFFLEVCEKAKSFKYVKKALYFYDRRNEESITNSYKKNLLEDLLYIEKTVREIFKRNGLDGVREEEILEKKIFDIYMACFFNEINYKKGKELRISLANLNKEVGEIKTKKIKGINGIYRIIEENISDKKPCIYKQIILGKLLKMKNK